jgi:3-deoxy-D-manno-octulosonate 8-phosphate phosphatase KdsC-like HAD superfamily phosphatase
MKNLKIHSIEKGLQDKSMLVDELLKQKHILQDLLDSLDEN